MIYRIKRYFRMRKAIKRYKLLASMIDSIDSGFERMRIPRWKRKQFWYDFVNSPESRKKFIQDMARGGL